MQKRTIFIIMLVSVALAGALGYWTFYIGQERDTDSFENVRIKLTSDVVLTDLEGNPVKMSDFQGHPIVLNLWASWCPYCRDELPAFVRLKKEFGERIIVIALNRGESLEKAKATSDEFGITSTLKVLLDPNDALYKQVGGFSMPETIFIDSEGVIQDHRRGPMPYEEMRRRTQNAFRI